MLDQRALKSPAGLPLVLPSRLMALAVAAEWEQQVQQVSAWSSRVSYGIAGITRPDRHVHML
jgi:chaperone required for assembly of F1-ATPase